MTPYPASALTSYEVSFDNCAGAPVVQTSYDEGCDDGEVLILIPSQEWHLTAWKTDQNKVLSQLSREPESRHAGCHTSQRAIQQGRPALASEKSAAQPMVKEHVKAVEGSAARHRSLRPGHPATNEDITSQGGTTKKPSRILPLAF